MPHDLVRSEWTRTSVVLKPTCRLFFSELFAQKSSDGTFGCPFVGRPLPSLGDFRPRPRASFPPLPPISIARALRAGAGPPGREQRALGHGSARHPSAPAGLGRVLGSSGQGRQPSPAHILPHLRLPHLGPRAFSQISMLPVIPCQHPPSPLGDPASHILHWSQRALHPRLPCASS